MTISVTRTFGETKGRKGSRPLRRSEPENNRPTSRLPRVTKLMALAIRFDQLIRDGVVKDQAEIARLGLVTRARVTQIMNLLNLAPEIQTAILDMTLVTKGRDFVTEREFRKMVELPAWSQQRRLGESFQTPLSADAEQRPPARGRVDKTSPATGLRPATPSARSIAAMHKTAPDK